MDLPDWIPASLKDDLINLLVGGELQRLTSKGLSPAGRERLIEAGVDLKNLDKTVGGAAGVRTSAFLADSKAGEALVRSDLLGEGKSFNFKNGGHGFAVPGSGGKRNWRIADGWDPRRLLARESKVGYQCNPPCSIRKILDQIDKDAALKGNKDYLELEWHLFPSARSGTVGAHPDIIKRLQSHGIPYSTKMSETTPRFFDELSRDEARALFEAYVAGHAGRVQELLDEVARNAGPVDRLDCTRESLVSLGAWYFGMHRPPERPASDAEMRASGPPVVVRVPRPPRSGDRAGSRAPADPRRRVSRRDDHPDPSGSGMGHRPRAAHG